MNSKSYHKTFYKPRNITHTQIFHLTRAKNEVERQQWIDVIEANKIDMEAISLRRHGSLMSLSSGPSLSSTSSFRHDRNLKEKVCLWYGLKLRFCNRIHLKTPTLEWKSSCRLCEVVGERNHHDEIMICVRAPTPQASTQLVI